MRNLQHYWLFIALSLFVSLQCVWYGHWLGYVILLWLLVRSYYAPRIVLVGCIVLMGLAVIYNIALKDDLQRNDDTTQFVITIDPYHTKSNDWEDTGIAYLYDKQRKIKVQWHADKAQGLSELQHYTRLEVLGQLQQPVKASNFGVFDYHHYLQSKGINNELEIMAVVKQHTLQNWQAMLLNMRLRFIHHFKKFNHIPIFSLYNRMIWNIDSQTYRDSRQTLLELGIVHFFALSGFHVSLIKKYLTYFLKRIGILNEISMILVDMLLVGYLFLTGFPIGAVRSVLMHFLAKNRASHRLDNLSQSALLIMLFQPYIVLSLGFQLSYLLTFILIFVERERSEITIASRLKVAIICLLFTWPLSISTSFQWFPLQIMWVILFGIVIDKMLVWLACIFTLGSFSTHFILLLQWFGHWEQVIIGHQPSIMIGKLSVLTILILWIVASLWLVNIKMAWKWTIVAYTLLILFAGRAHFERIVIFDVGQGDALLYQPLGSASGWLIDVGGQVTFNHQAQNINQNYGERTLIPALKALGIKKIDGIILTHSDYDHIGNLQSVVMNYPVQHIITNAETNDNTYFQNVLQKLKATKHLVIAENQWFAVTSHVKIYTHQVLGEDSANNQSIIALIQLGDAHFLNLADLDTTMEEQLIRNFSQLTADIIKVGHHGSQTSTSDSLLQQLKAKIAIISVGKNNRYGHPHPLVLEKLQAHELTIFQTQQHGAMMLINDPFRKLTIKTKLNE